MKESNCYTVDIWVFTWILLSLAFLLAGAIKLTGIFTFCAIKLIGIFTYSVTRKLVQFSCEGMQMVCIYRFSPVIFTCSGSTSSAIICSALVMSYLILCYTAMHDVMNMILQGLFCYPDINFLDHLISILSFEGALWIFFILHLHLGYRK
jgi:hypothetical protein